MKYEKGFCFLLFWIFFNRTESNITFRRGKNALSEEVDGTLFPRNEDHGVDRREWNSTAGKQEDVNSNKRRAGLDHGCNHLTF